LKEQTEQELIDAVQRVFTAVVAARVCYGMTEEKDLDFILANDEMNFPLEVHPRWILDMVGKCKTYLDSCGFEKVRFTVLFFVTLAGRKLPPVFVLAGGKTLRHKSKQWAEQWLPADQHAFFFFNDSAYMTAPLYACVLRELRTWLRLNAGHPRNSHYHVLHDRAPAHVEKNIATALAALNMSSTAIEPTCLLQILDVGLARAIRAGYLADFLLRGHYAQQDRDGGETAVGLPL
jgi:hypothetical protein